MTDSVRLIHATSAHVEAVAPLFDAYRSWYGQASDLDGARGFLAARLVAGESEIFYATVNDRPVAFTQLYPLFSSVAMEAIWILNDLYVAESVRRQGIGALLLGAAAEFARGVGAVRLELSTETENRAAQNLYESLGWVKDTDFLEYKLHL